MDGVATKKVRFFHLGPAVWEKVVKKPVGPVVKWWMKKVGEFFEKNPTDQKPDLDAIERHVFQIFNDTRRREGGFGTNGIMGFTLAVCDGCYGLAACKWPDKYSMKFGRLAACARLLDRLKSGLSPQVWAKVLFRKQVILVGNDLHFFENEKEFDVWMELRKDRDENQKRGLNPDTKDIRQRLGELKIQMGMRKNP